MTQQEFEPNSVWQQQVQSPSAEAATEEDIPTNVTNEMFRKFVMNQRRGATEHSAEEFNEAGVCPVQLVVKAPRNL